MTWYWRIPVIKGTRLLMHQLQSPETRKQNVSHTHTYRPALPGRWLPISHSPWWTEPPGTRTYSFPPSGTRGWFSVSRLKTWSRCRWTRTRWASWRSRHSPSSPGWSSRGHSEVPSPSRMWPLLRVDRSFWWGLWDCEGGMSLDDLCDRRKKRLEFLGKESPFARIKKDDLGWYQVGNLTLSYVINHVTGRRRWDSVLKIYQNRVERA